MIPYALAVRAPVRDRARHARAPRDAARATAHRRRSSSGSARRCRSRCAAAPTSATVERGAAARHAPAAARRPLGLRGRASRCAPRSTPSSTPPPAAGSPARRRRRSRWRSSTSPARPRAGRSGRCSAPPERTPVRCNATLVAGTPAEVAADAERWAARGFTTFKLKLGAGDDVAQVRAVREALGPRGPDPPRRQRRLERRRGARGAADDRAARGSSWSSSRSHELRELAAVTAATSIPIAADESVERGKDAAAGGAARAPATWRP